MKMRFLSVPGLFLCLITVVLSCMGAVCHADPSSGVRRKTMERLVRNVNAISMDTDPASMDRKVETSLSHYRPDGSFDDIDYSDRRRATWSPSTHVTRMYDMAVAYASPESRYFNSSDILSRIRLSLDYWCTGGIEPCTNWWFNEIRIPWLMGMTALLIKDDMDATDMENAVSVMDSSRFGMTGQNKVALAGNMLYRALLTDDCRLAVEARDTILSEIRITTDEGLQPDWSYHQHGPQMQFGNYGLAYLDRMSYWLKVFDGTGLSADSAQLGILRDFADKGIGWTVWKGLMDQNALGRQIQKGRQKDKAVNFVHCLSEMASLHPPVRVRRNGRDGSMYYYRSDFGVLRNSRWYLSVRMQSDRTVGFEAVNGENMKGYYSSDGAMLVKRDGNEYYDISPLWNWKHVPGTTICDYGQKLWGIRWDKKEKHPPFNRTDMVGGVSDGQNLCCMMQYDRDSVSVKKGYFCFQDGAVVLGTDLSGPGYGEIVITVQQCRASGEISREGGKVSHGGLFYEVLYGGEIQAGITMRRGMWDDFSTLYTDVPAEGEVFEMGFVNDTSSFAYTVSPDRGFGYSILSNTSGCQAVASDGIMMAVFYSPGSIRNGDTVYAVSAPCTLISDGAGNIWLSEPTGKAVSLHLDVSADGDVRYDGTVSLPSGIYSRSAVRLTVR